MYGNLKLAIWKYKLEPVDEQILAVSYPAKVLSVGEQRGDIVLYALVAPESLHGQTNVTVRIHGTGHQVANDISNFDFVGTVKLMDGALMFHVFVGK